jgi:polar amino acid transport system substrate-binding protein
MRLPAVARSILLLPLLLPLLLLAAPLRAETVKLTSLDWPPFSGPTVPASGAATAVVQEAFRNAGDTLLVSFMGWQEAVDTALKGPDYVGYFPEYFSAEMDGKTCAFSQPIGSSPLGLVERREKPVAWKTLNDLQGQKIGTVQGYVNTAEFDSMAAAGTLTVDAAPDDATNLRRVADGTLPLAVIDRNVMEYLLNFDDSLKGLKAGLRFNPKPLENKELFVCFRTDAKGLATRDRFNKALATIDVGQVQGEVLKLMNR